MIIYCIALESKLSREKISPVSISVDLSSCATSNVDGGHRVFLFLSQYSMLDDIESMMVL